MRAKVNNSIGNLKLKFSDVRNGILAKEVRRKDLGKVMTLKFVVYVGTKGRSYEKSSNWGHNRLNLKNGKGKSREWWNVEC